MHVYGVDLMSTSECLSYFAEWGPTFCEWINDSSCELPACIADHHSEEAGTSREQLSIETFAER